VLPTFHTKVHRLHRPLAGFRGGVERSGTEEGTGNQKRTRDKEGRGRKGRGMEREERRRGRGIVARFIVL